MNPQTQTQEATAPLVDLPLYAAQEAAAKQQQALPEQARTAADSAELETRAADLVKLKRLETDEQLEQAAELNRVAVSLIGKAEGLLRPVIQAQHEAHKLSLAALKELVKAPGQIKRATSFLMGEYRSRRQREAEEERRLLEEEARKAEEARRERDLEAALEAGDEDGALAILEEPEVPVPVVAVAEVPKVEGFRTVERWGFELADRRVPGAWSEVVEKLSGVDPQQSAAVVTTLREMFGLEPSYLIPDEKQIGAEVRALKDAKRSRQIIGPAVLATKTVTQEPTGR